MTGQQSYFTGDHAEFRTAWSPRWFGQAAGDILESAAKINFDHLAGLRVENHDWSPAFFIYDGLGSQGYVAQVAFSDPARTFERDASHKGNFTRIK